MVWVWLGLLGFALLSIAACFMGLHNRTPRIPVAPMPPDAAADARALRAPPDRALLIVAVDGQSGALDIAVDGERAAQLRRRTFTALPVSPGRHVLEARNGKPGKGTSAKLDVSPGFGEVVVVHIRVVAWKAHTNFYLTRLTKPAEIEPMLAQFTALAPLIAEVR